MNLSAKSIINRIVVGTVLFSVGALIGVFWAARSDPDWISFFNSEDLDGWKVWCLEEDVGKNYWRVEDGYIVCDSMGDKNHKSVWLQHVVELDEFELKLKL